MNYVYAFVELFIFLQDINTSVDNNSSYPAFKSAPVTERMHLRKDLDKTFLQHILCILTIMCETITHRQHLRTIPIIYCLLYTSDAADERSSVDLGGRRII